MPPDAEFVRRLLVLAEVMGEQLSPVRIAGYWAALDDQDPADLWASMDHALKTNKFFPRPAELREHAASLASARAERRRLEHPHVPHYLRLEAGNTPASAEQVEAFFREMRTKLKTMPGPSRRPHGRRAT